MPDDTPQDTYRFRIVAVLAAADTRTTDALRQDVDAPDAAESVHTTPFGKALYALYDDGHVALADADTWTLAEPPADETAADGGDGDTGDETIGATDVPVDAPEWYDHDRLPPLDATPDDFPVEVEVYARSSDDDEYTMAMAAHYADGDDTVESALRWLGAEVLLRYRVHADGDTELLACHDPSTDTTLTADDDTNT